MERMELRTAENLTRRALGISPFSSYLSGKFGSPLMKKFHLLVCLLLVASIVAEAQYSYYSLRKERKLIGTIGLNTSTYYGDLKDNSDIIDAQPSISLGLMTSISKIAYVRYEFSWLTLSGSDAESLEEGKIRRNLSFVSNNYEFNITWMLHLVPHARRFYQRPDYNVYGFFGLGALYYNPKAILDGKKYPLQPLRTEGVNYSRFAFVIPFGIGAKRKINPFVDVVVEAGWRKTFTDYIDDVSTVFVDNNAFTDPIAQQLADRRPEIDLPVMEAGKKRGEPSNKDAYMLISLKIEYYMPYQPSAKKRTQYKKQRRIYR